MPRNEETVSYMERTREYYRALGYEKDYVWAHYDDVPFARLAKPLREANGRFVGQHVGNVPKFFGLHGKCVDDVGMGMSE